MKHNLSKRLLSLLLTLIMVVGTMPALPSLVSADTSMTIIDNLDFEFNLDRLPKAGKDVIIYGDEILTSDMGRPYSIQPRYRWHSDIPNGYDNDVVRHFYEINDSSESVGYSFERGKTYIFHMACSLDKDFKDTHRFYSRAETVDGKKTTVTFSNLPSSSYYIVAAEASTDYIGIYVAITIDGVCPYDDIKTVYANWDKNYVYPPMAGRQSGYAYANYGNFSEKRRWEGEFDYSEYGGAFYKAGEHYTYTIAYTARDGYKFASDVEYIFDRGRPDSVKLSDDRKTLTVVFEFDVSDIVYIDNVLFYDADSLGYLDWLLPNVANGITDCYQLDVDSEAPYRETDCSGWRDENDEPVTSFSSNQVYFFRQTYEIKNSDTHKFPKDVTSVVEGLSENGYTAEVQWISEREITVTYIFAEGYSRNVGKVPSEPVKCNSFFALKWALENPNIQYIQLGDCISNLPLIKKEAGDTNTFIDAITVKDNKYLTISGNAEFTAIEVDETAYYAYNNFICVPEGAKLEVNGEGSVTYNGYNLETNNSVFCVQYGVLTVDGCTVNGVTKKSGSFSPAIINMFGTVTIKSGNFYGYNLSSLGLGAVTVIGGDTIIENGRFEVLGAGIENYGLKVMTNPSDVIIERGDFYSNGIKMPSDSMPLSHYADSNDHIAMRGSTVYETNELYQSDIDNSYVRPLKICKIVKSAGIVFDIPVAGNKVDVSPEITEGIKVKSVSWYANGSKIPMASTSAFALNSTYSVKITIEADSDSNYALGDIDIFKCKINGKSVDLTSAAGGYEMSFDFGQCKNTLTSVYLTGLTIPKEFGTPDGSVVADTESSGKISISSDIFWYEDGVLMESGELFKNNSFYVIKVPVYATSNYIFNVDADGTPLLDCYINGMRAYSESYEDKSGTKYAVIVLELGYLHGTVVEEVSLSIDLPTAGQYPQYKAYCHDQYNEYYIDESQNAWYEEYIGFNAGVCTYYKIRGVSWYDVTDSGYVYENETFIAGHTYQVYIDIRPYEGYEFLFKSVAFGDDLLLSATVNGEAAEASMWGNDGLYKQGVTYTFVCQPATISNIEITGFSSPVAGKTPDYTMDFDSELYQLKTDFGTDNTGIEWYTSAGDLMSPNDTFVEGESYMVRIRIEPVEIDGNKMCKFYNGTSITLNGEKVKEASGGNLINRNTNRIELFYYFQPTPSEKTILVGDINADGKYTATDYLMLKKVIFGTLKVDKLKEPETAFERCDVIADGTLKAADYFKLKRMIFQ